MKEENLNLSRELADACREIVEVQFAYSDLLKKHKSTEIAFIQFLLENKVVLNIEDAKRCVKIQVAKITNPPVQQLSFNFPKIEEVVNV